MKPVIIKTIVILLLMTVFNIPSLQAFSGCSKRCTSDKPVNEKALAQDHDYNAYKSLIQNSLEDKTFRNLMNIYASIEGVLGIVDKNKGKSENLPDYLDENSHDYYKKYLSELGVKLFDSDFFLKILESIEGHIVNDAWVDNLNGEALSKDEAFLYSEVTQRLAKAFINEHIDQTLFNPGKFAQLRGNADKVVQKADTICDILSPF